VPLALGAVVRLIFCDMIPPCDAFGLVANAQVNGA
jgi:hypothetical protein